MSDFRNEPGIVSGELTDVLQEVKQVGDTLKVFNDALNNADPDDDGWGDLADVAYRYVDPAQLANLNNAAIPVVRALSEARNRLDEKARRLANELAATSWARKWAADRGG